MQNVEYLFKMMDELHPVIHATVTKNRAQGRPSSSNGSLPNFDVGYYVLVERSDFFAVEK